MHGQTERIHPLPYDLGGHAGGGGKGVFYGSQMGMAAPMVEKTNIDGWYGIQTGHLVRGDG